VAGGVTGPATNPTVVWGSALSTMRPSTPLSATSASSRSCEKGVRATSPPVAAFRELLTLCGETEHGRLRPQSMNTEAFVRGILLAAVKLDARQRESDGAVSITIDLLLREPDLRIAALEWERVEPPESLIVLLGIRAGHAVLAVWSAAFPTLLGPSSALEAADQWAATRTLSTAEAAAVAAELAAAEAQNMWSQNRTAAWAGRTCSWSAMGPRYNWAAVAALAGAARVSSETRLSKTLADYLTALHAEKC
jgi:hypothetical protein